MPEKAGIQGSPEALVDNMKRAGQGV